MTDTFNRTSEALQAAGYRVIVRQHEWAECLLVGDDDRWLGRGADASGALQDALRQALPSRLARQLFDRLADAPNRVAQGPAATPSVPVTAPAAPTPQPSPAPAMPAVVAPTPVAARAPLIPMDPHPAVSPAAPPPAPRTVLDEEALADVPRMPSAREVLDELRAMRKQIETDAEELALASPRRQRLVMLGWITRARAAQMPYPDDGKIDTAVANIAKALTAYCQTWWPGSVRALKVSTRPEDVVHDLTMQVARPPSSWAEACELAERNVRMVEEEDENRGRDGYGWADVTRFNPPPRDTDAMLAEIIKEVEELSGPIGVSATKTDVPPPHRFVEWCRKLRWARETTNDPMQWGALMGRFRFWIREHGQKYPDSARVLDPDWSPDKSWAATLGMDPETIQRNREIRELFNHPPKRNEDGTFDVEAVHTWLARALTYSDTHLSAIVPAVATFKEHLLGLEENALPGSDRRMRRRFSKLQKELAAPTPSMLPPPPPTEPEGPESASDPAPDPNVVPEELRGPIVKLTRGKRALFVSNRADPNLRDRLKQIFEFEELDWSSGETKRRQALTNPIQSGTYDFVLGATGFLSHSIDGQISQACRKGNVPYIRVHRGRPVALSLIHI